MASLNLRWVCAPLLFVSSVIFAQDGPRLPPVFTEYEVLWDDMISTPRGDGACVAGYVEAICSTGASLGCFGYGGDDGPHKMRVRSTGYYCGEWEESNNQLLDPPEAIGLTDSELSRIDNLFDLIQNALNRAGDWRRVAFSSDVNSMLYNEAVTNVSVNFSNAISHLQTMSSLISDSVSSLRDYTIHVDRYYESIDSTNESIFDINSKIHSLNSETQGLAGDISKIESKLDGLNFDDDTDIQGILDSIESLDGDFSSLLDEIRGVYREISSLRVEMYGQISDLRTEFNSSKQATNDELAIIRGDIRDTERKVYDSVFPAIGEVYGHIGNELGAVYEHVDNEITALTDSIDTDNAGIVSSIDSQTGKIIGAIDGQTGEIVGAIDGQSSIISDGFSDLTDFFGDGEPSAGDLASQDSELSGLVSDYDYFVDYNIDIGEAVCPAPYQLDLTITGKTVYVSFEPMCEASVLVKPLLIAASSVAFALIVMGVRRA